jgi:hypothetical protein
MYLGGKAMHVTRRESKAVKQVLSMPPGGSSAIPKLTLALTLPNSRISVEGDLVL